VSLQSLLDEYTSREVKPKREPLSAGIDRANKVWDVSVQKNIPTQEADDVVTAEELQFHVNSLQNSPAFQDIDALLDMQPFDPAEPPRIDGEPPKDALATLARAEARVLTEPVKWAFKAMNFAFSPFNRGMKFLANAMLLDPLSKSASGPIKKYAVSAAIEREMIRREIEFRQKHTLEPSQPLPPEEIEKIAKESNEAAAGLINRVNSEVEDIDVEPGDFGRSILDAGKALVPWPGIADDVRTFGEIQADSFERIVGRDAPWFYAPIADTAMDTLAFAGITKMAMASQVADDSAMIARAAKLTKNERRAIKRAHKMASQVTPEKAVSATVPSLSNAETAKLKLIKLIKEAKPLKSQKARLLRKDRQMKAKKLLQVQKNVKGERLVGATKGVLKGKAPLPDFTPLNTSMTAQEIDILFNTINTSPVKSGFDKGRAFLALDELLNGKIITKSQIANLETVFGREFTRALAKKRGVGEFITDLSFEVVNLPRAVMASFDLSAPLRQGIIFSVSHPIASMKAYARSVRAAASLKYADDIERVTLRSEFGKMADEFGVHSSPTGFTAKIAGKEEPYMSRLAERIPGVAASERGFTTFLNQQRREVFTNQAKAWIKRGITPDSDPKSYEQLAKFINHATGRGSLENLQPGALTALNATFFSPRFQVSRAQVIGDLVNPNTTKHVRKVVARDLAEFYATGMGMLAMAEMAGAEVEKNPLSSDFGKIKVGNTRYNYWGAFQPLATFAARVASGKVKSTGTGKIKDKNRAAIVGSFLRTKLAPVPGGTVDVLTGETMAGEPVEATGEFAGKKAYEMLTPLFIQDVVDALEYQEVDGQLPISAGLAFHGIGVQTWELAPFAELELERDSLSRQTYGRNYDELTWPEATTLDADILMNHPGIVELERQVKFEQSSVNFARKQMLDARKSERFIMKRMSKELLSDLEEMKLRVGGVDRSVGQWRLNDEQYKEYQEKTAKNINEIFDSMRPVWDRTDIDSYTKYEMASTILRRAKLKASNEMRIGDME
jgi:hypothetical protein